MGKNQSIAMYHSLLTDSLLLKMTLNEKLGQCFMPAVFINDSEAEVQKIEQLIAEFHIGSICFFHSRASAATNFEGKKKVVHNEQSYDRLLHLIERYQKAAKYPLLIAIDAEWGLSMRIENTPQYPYALTLGAMQDKANVVFDVGRQIALDCKEAGIHWNLGPVVDINNNPNNPVIGYRSFGDSRSKVASYAQAYLEGMNSGGVLNSIKHFPGHGDTAVDSHLGLPKIEKTKEELLQNELYPFIKLIENGVDSVMVGHLCVPALSDGKSISASLSKEIITDFLKKELNYRGLILSDALNMHSVSKQFETPGEVEFRAFEAGNDVLCFPNDVEAGINTILKKCSDGRIEDSFNRIWRLKKKGLGKNKTHEKRKPLAILNTLVARESLTVLKETDGIFKSFRDQGFRYVEIGCDQPSLFSQLVEPNNSNTENVVLALFPPQMKPKDQFGLSQNDLAKIKKLLGKRRVILYLFGNPFVLNLFDYKMANALILAYQNFKVFQRNAAEHFLGREKALGSLPISLNQGV